MSTDGQLDGQWSPDQACPDQRDDGGEGAQRGRAGRCCGFRESSTRAPPQCRGREGSTGPRRTSPAPPLGTPRRGEPTRQVRAGLGVALSQQLQGLPQRGQRRSRCRGTAGPPTSRTKVVAWERPPANPDRHPKLLPRPASRLVQPNFAARRKPADHRLPTPAGREFAGKTPDCGRRLAEPDVRRHNDRRKEEKHQDDSRHERGKLPAPPEVFHQPFERSLGNDHHESADEQDRSHRPQHICAHRNEHGRDSPQPHPVVRAITLQGRLLDGSWKKRAGAFPRHVFCPVTVRFGQPRGLNFCALTVRGYPARTALMLTHFARGTPAGIHMLARASGKRQSSARARKLCASSRINRLACARRHWRQSNEQHWRG